MKRYPQPELHFDEKGLKTDLGKGNTIFVGSSCDMWAEDVSSLWVRLTLAHCIDKHPFNNYLFQSKNPDRFREFASLYPPNFMIGCTIETNRDYSFISKAPATYNRKVAIERYAIPKMISIEPIMDFDLEHFPKWIEDIKPEFVSIGADSGNNHLPEPSAYKIKALIGSLKEFTEVKVKDNLKRLL